jgi:hypothetical protein
MCGRITFCRWDQVVDKIVNVPVSARGGCQPLFVANSGDQVIDGRHSAAELIPRRWRWRSSSMVTNAARLVDVSGVAWA